MTSTRGRPELSDTRRSCLPPVRGAMQCTHLNGRVVRKAALHAAGTFARRLLFKLGDSLDVLVREEVVLVRAPRGEFGDDGALVAGLKPVQSVRGDRVLAARI